MREALQAKNRETAGPDKTWVSKKHNISLLTLLFLQYKGSHYYLYRNKSLIVIELEPLYFIEKAQHQDTSASCCV